MDLLRRRVLYSDAILPLSPKESAKGDWSVRNPTWLAEHRPDPCSHPEAKNIPANKVRCYHLYTNPEDSHAPDLHWKTREPPLHQFYGYNPTFKTLDNSFSKYKCMFLPIYQRYVWLMLNRQNFQSEMFDNLMPYSFFRIGFWKI